MGYTEIIYSGKEVIVKLVARQEGTSVILILQFSQAIFPNLAREVSGKFFLLFHGLQVFIFHQLHVFRFVIYMNIIHSSTEQCIQAKECIAKRQEGKLNTYFKLNRMKQIFVQM